jgi:hypothetical protein
MRQFVNSLCLLSLGLNVLSHPALADSASEQTTPEVNVFPTSDGEESHVAIAIKSQRTPKLIKRHVILIDTSASQIGRFRNDTLRVLRSLAKVIPKDHQVFLVAVDSIFEPLSEGFVAAGSKEFDAAIQQASDRTPLGATDLLESLRKAVVLADADEPASLLYMGDGISASNLLSLEDLTHIVSRMTDAEVSFHAMLLGPTVDTELSGILANLTGGTMCCPNRIEADVIAEKLSDAISIPPEFVSNLTSANSDLSLACPMRIALRSDRHSLIFGKGTPTQELTLTAIDASGHPRNWMVKLSDNTFGNEIRLLYERSAASNGLNSPVVGMESLQLASTEFATSVNRVIVTAKQSALRGDQSIAFNLARRASQLTGGDHRLTALMAELEKTPATPEPESSMATGNDVPGPQQANSGELLAQSEMKIMVRTQRLVQQVNAAIKEAKEIAGEKPDYSLTRLKDVLETILSTPELAPEKRTELERRVIDAIGFVQFRREKEAVLQRERFEARAILEAERRTLTEMQLEDERLQTMISQVRGLLDRATHGDNEAFEDAERVARTALDTKPGDGTATAALVMSETTGQLSKAYRLKNLRQDRFLEVLYQVELSHVPFPDEPPVIYPPADVWRVLSLTRKRKYESVSLRNEKPVEKWLQRMMDEPVKDLSFPGENPLTDILEQIRTHFTTTYGTSGSAGADYRMTILPDLGALNDDSVQLQDVMIKDIELDGITLRNALAIILSQTDPELTYMIRNEVMFITTRAFAEADEQLQTRVYQVGDLVIPPVQLGGSGIGGGGQGGLGGGGAGGLGGGGSGGFGGGGAGFSLSPETLINPAAKSNGGISNDTLNSSATNQHNRF